jgi:hypothetical protein
MKDLLGNPKFFSYSRENEKALESYSSKLT